ncbi:hypothetical protein DFH06DRAFT_1353013 [Mycena polygramma]|nr:hypothetical protein DFH06DRAFT_1353013 [Mycena polygramma]
MGLTTHGEAHFSPFTLPAAFTNEKPAIFQAHISIAPFLCAAIDAEAQRATALEENLDKQVDAWEDEDDGPILSRPATPLSREPTPLSFNQNSPPSSPSSRSSSPLSDVPPSRSPSSPATQSSPRALSPQPRKDVGSATRSVVDVTARPFGRPLAIKHDQTYRTEKACKTTFLATGIPFTSGGGWRASPTKRRRLVCHSIQRLKELLEDDCDLLKWEGCDPKLILDTDKGIVGVLLGWPEGPDWEQVVTEMAAILEALHRCGKECGIFKASQRSHRRSSYYTLGHATTKGPEQKKPGNLVHSKKYCELLQVLLLNHNIRRIAGFQSTATWNLGPAVVTIEHEDVLNAHFFMCAITSTGNYNYKRGGQLYMKQLKLVIEFPPGSTILLLSAAITHGNTPVAKEETRYSMTQYCADLYGSNVTRNTTLKMLPKCCSVTHNGPPVA